jgi:hypothetical protein
MAGDFSRNSVNPPKHYSGVLMQQGRVQVDADWNEQLALQHYRTYTETRDVIGNCGTPKKGGGFNIDLAPGGGDLLISSGRYYVHGLLCDLHPQKVLVSFPAANPPIAAAATTASTLRPKRGQVIPSIMRRTPSSTQRTMPLVHWTDPQGQVNVPSLQFDDRALIIGNWIELSTAGKKPLLARITKISDNTQNSDPDGILPNYYTLTLDKSVSPFQNANEVWLSRAVTFTTQPYFHSQLDESLEISPLSPAQAKLQLADGTYLVALEVWEREVDALEDPHIREVALGGPDTAERLQVVWQVHLVPYSEQTSPPNSPLESPPSSPPLDCCSDFPGWDQYKATLVTTGLMNAQAPPPGNDVNPCQLPPSAGFLGLANQLYRVEIFQSGHYNQQATLVWSRDNAMVETDILCVDATGIVYVSDLGKDDLHSFTENDWVEIFTVEDELLGKPRFLAQITAPTGASSAPPCAPGASQAFTLALTPSPTAFFNQSNLRLRRWDMLASTTMAQDVNGNPVGIPITPGWIQLENNVQVNFTPGFYAARSYWQIPARTATGDIEWPPFEVPNTNPIPQPPLGVQHYFCRLALLTVTGGKWHLKDCRCKFPALTDICADDICYHSNRCELQEVATVQEALDKLDAKIRFHNKMLHGWGVVCGLAVACGGEKHPTSVSVARGYAIDCEGEDLLLDKSTVVDFTQLLTLSPQQHRIPDGEYELLIEPAAAHKLQTEMTNTSEDEACCSKSPGTASPEPCFKFRAIPCEKETPRQQIFDGTLLLDFYNHCLKPFIDEFTSKYTKAFISSDKQVTKAEALLSSLTNLFIQFGQPQLKDVWISPQEDLLLKEFYTFVAGQIHDKTLCSLSSSLSSYPAYPFANAAIASIFGKGFKIRMRVDPRGRFACAVGGDNNIHVYDLQSGQLASVVELPVPGNASGWVVQDVAFNDDGLRVYAIATGTNSNTNSPDSVFGVGTFNPNDFTIQWESTGSVGAFPFVTLASVPGNQKIVFATVRGQGLFSISVPANSPATPFAKFNAFGHLLLLNKNVFATANSGIDTSSFNQILRMEVNPGTNPVPIPLPQGTTGDATDDFLVQSVATAGEQLFVTAKSAAQSNKQLLIFANSQLRFTVDLGETATLRLAANPPPNFLMISFEESCQIQILDMNSLTGNATPAVTRYAPVEVHPTSIAVAGHGVEAKTHVLNSTSNTISVVPGSMQPFTDFARLEKYRDDALNAYLQLLAAFLQNLKDCFCDLLLVKCPECNREKLGVPLACVTFKNGQVEHVCNFEKRKYVKTFPTLEYWFSLIPVVPLVRTLFEKFCCAVLPSLLKDFQANNSRGSFARGVAPESIRNSIQKVREFSTSNIFSSALGKLAPVGKFTLDAVRPPVQPSVPTSGVGLNQITGQPVKVVEQTLRASDIQVAGVVPYDPTNLGKNLLDYANAPAVLPPKSSVTLVADSEGVVKYYIPSSTDVAQLSASVQASQQEMQKQIGAVTTESQQLQSQMTALQKAQSPVLDTISTLQKQLSDVTSQDQQLQTQLTTLQQAQKPAQDTISALQKQVTTLQGLISDIQTVHSKELAVRDQQIQTLTTTTQQLQSKLQTVDTLSNQVKELASKLPKPPQG